MPLGTNISLPITTRRGLQKLLALHQHIFTLVRLPRSPTRRHLLSKALVVRCIDPKRIHYPLQLHPALPKEIYRHFYSPPAEESVEENTMFKTLTEWQTNTIEHFTPSNSDTPSTLESVVHAECTLLLDVHKDERITQNILLHWCF